MSHYNLARFHGTSDDAEQATAHLAQCHAVLRSMRDREMFLDPPLVNLPQQLVGQFGER